MKTTVINLEDKSFNQSIQDILARLLDSGLVGSILLPKKTTGGDNYVQALVKNPRLLADTDVSAPVILVQSARLISNLTFGDPGERIAVVVKPCEARAVVELTKFRQIRRESLLIIAVDCLGTYEPKVFSTLAKSGKDPAADLRKQAASGRCEPDPEASFRTACTICEHPSVPLELVDLIIGLWGIDCEENIYIEAADEVAAQMEEKGVLEFNGGEQPRRSECLSALREERVKARDRVLGDFSRQVSSLKELQKLLSTCMRCHNCMINCPICYCRECVFRSPTFEHTPDQYLGWARDKGAIRMPTDTMMLHLTRLNHMVISCVGCGLCDTACPSDIPVTSLFRTVGLRAQKMMEYEPGRSYDEPAPATTFRDDELLHESGTAN
ncbi:MAG: Coenzyme F420 hydrogenase/dehydrogenase, beta subunit C-terminal domain [Spirochaetales bacterium]|nr:Coenzyme F420 hydrogenase/dehydrogenase, beta subunit C-terminal domain [Spirochaetales bacterium]